MNMFHGKTYAESIALIADTWGDREALVYGGRRYTFRQIKEEIDKASRKFLAIGLKKGDKIAVWLPNRPELLFAWLGAGQAGLTAVIMNTRLRIEEAAYQISQSDSRAVIVAGDGAFRDFIKDLASLCPGLADSPPGTKCGGTELPLLENVIALDPTAHELAGVRQWDEIEAGPDTPIPYETNPDSPAMIAYSSGTTALPKGAVLSHCIWRKAADHGARFYQTPDDRLYLCVPLFSILSTVNGVVTFWAGGSSVVLDDRFDPEMMLSAIEREKCTAAYLLPLMIQRAVELPNFNDFDISSLRTGIVVSTAPEAFKMAAEKLGMHGFITSYGMTETSSACTRTWSDDPFELRVQNHGKPLPDIEVRVADPETDVELKRGEIGELQVRGYNTMLEYYNKPEETARAFAEGRWYKTGDAGIHFEDGSFQFLRRLSDGYKHKGFNVSTAEVEAAAERHPAVNRAAVFGIPDKQFEYIGIAFVILNDGAKADEEEIARYLKEHLASFKVPAHIFFTDEFPMTAGTEKVQKFKLREIALQKLAEDPAEPV